MRPSAYETTLPPPMVGPAVVYDPYARPQATQDGLQFHFVARVSPEQRKAALARAFAKAEAEAEEMASAAGRGLGPLLSLDGQFQRRVSPGHGAHAYPVAGNSAYAGPDPSPHADESAASDPRSIAFRAEVNATFRLP
ncbi:MAG: SIMPL domain-containing protein [Candidatus Nealsonbacteria bacterium]|nr:SIMPL domain-containing protein [Candidatus Nealsonbacteria bacterium]